MKIIIHSIEELLQLSELVSLGEITRKMQQVDLAQAPTDLRDKLSRAFNTDGIKRQRTEGLISAQMAAENLVELGALPDDIDAPQAVVTQAAAEDVARTDAIAAEVEGQEFPERDADGAKYSTDWHSDPKKLTAKNVWRAKRGRDEAAYKWHLQEQAVAEADEEPVATETHALPQDGLPDDSGPIESRSGHPMDTGELPQVDPEASTVDLQALVAASQEAAKDAKDGLQDLLAGCRDFTSAHGTAEFNALKAAVAPRGDTGASLQEFTPAERRLMLACIANYPKKEA